MSGSAPIDFAMVMQTTPMVAAVPNEVPVKNDMMPVRTNVASGAIAGVTNGEATSTISDTVPEARQSAVRIPMRMKAVSTPLAVAMPSRPMRMSSRRSQPLCMP